MTTKEIKLQLSVHKKESEKILRDLNIALNTFDNLCKKYALVHDLTQIRITTDVLRTAIIKSYVLEQGKLLATIAPDSGATYTLLDLG